MAVLVVVVLEWRVVIGNTSHAETERKGDLYLYALVISDFLKLDGFIIAYLKIMGYV